MIRRGLKSERERGCRRRAASLIFALILCACDQGVDAVATADNNTAAALPAWPENKAAAAMTATGPHGEKDPHAALTPAKHIQVALRHLREGRAPQALQTVDKAISRHPNNAELRALRGSLHLAGGDYTLALADLDTALNKTPDRPAWLVNRAQVYEKFNRRDAALVDLNRAIAIKPDFLPARFNRGTIYFNMSDLQAALTDFNQCIATDPHTPAPYFNRAAVHDALDNRAEAVADIERFLQLSDNQQWNAKAQELLALWRR